MIEPFIRLFDRESCCGCEINPAGRLFLCQKCLPSLSSRLTKLSPLVFVKDCWALLPYEGVGGALVRKAKFQPNLRLASQLGRRLSAAVEPLAKPDAVVSVPSPPGRLRSRGFNLAGVLADKIATSLNVPYFPRALKRIDNGRQSSRTELSRRQRLAGRFLLDAIELPPHVMVVDDVLTTGGTMDAVALSLLGVCERVSGVVVASRQI